MPPPSKKLKKNHSAIPKIEELENLREVESLFHSSLFKMQVDELLKEMNIEMIPEEWINQFKDFLKNIPETDQFLIDDFPLKSVQLPIFKKKTGKGIFKFLPPEKITEVGSFVLNTVCSSLPYIIDMAVEVPKACWQSMDYLNERYHRKRALYLAYIAESLQEAEFIENLKFSLQNDCHLKPVLLIVPKGITDCVVSLSAYPNENAFKLTRFVPTRNNVRSSWFLGITEDDLDAATPYYNSTILADLLLINLNNYLKENLTRENVQNGIKLVKLWLIQRGLLSGYGRLSGFIISMFVVYLLKKQKINAFMNPYQIFRCTLLAFQHENLAKGISLSNDSSTGQPALEDFHRFPGVFLDESGFLNLLYPVNKETLDMVKHEAKLGLDILDGELTNCFALLFLKKMPPLEKFEYLIHLKGPKKFRKYSEMFSDIQNDLDFGENKIAVVIPKLCSILHKGLNKRVLLLDVSKSSPSPWTIYNVPPSPNCGHVTIGLLLNPEMVLTNIEKGPLADDPEAEEFRKFWGKQSELRRFQDGSIREAVYWPATTFEDKRKAFAQMITDILKRHLNSKEGDFSVNGTDVDCVLHISKHALSSVPYGTGEEAHVTLMDSYNSLSKLLRNLDGLPLQVSSVQGISPAFHYSEVFPPLPTSFSADDCAYVSSNSILKMKNNIHHIPAYTPALNVVIEFEGSGKWPDDVEAIKRVKAAFLIKIADIFKSKYHLIAVPFLSHLDILKDGFVFRIFITSHKEIYLLKTHTLPNGATKIQDTEESRQLELITKVYPKLNSLLHGLNQQHFTYGTACRLAKRWMSSQLKHDCIHSTVIELLVAHVYIHPEPYTCPSSPQTGFLRFLSLIAYHDWKSNPLIVNLNNELQKSEMEEIYSSFTAQRSTLPPMVIAAPFDKRGALWTKNKPINLILEQIVTLAKDSLDTFQNMLLNKKRFDVKDIFRPDIESFNVVIHLNCRMIPKLKYALNIHDSDEISNFEPYNECSEKIYPIVDFDPAQRYYEELKINFDEFAHFFYDTYGGDFIGVMWKKSAFAPKEFKVSHLNCHYSKGDSIVGNRKSIIEDFKILGAGLVKHITKPKQFVI